MTLEVTTECDKTCECIECLIKRHLRKEFPGQNMKYAIMVAENKVLKIGEGQFLCHTDMKMYEIMNMLQALLNRHIVEISKNNKGETEQ